MNLLSEHNRILRLGEGGSQEYFAGPNINITDHVISGKYWDNEINSAISSTSGDIVNEAVNQSTAWVDEQGYLTAHQDVDNLPYVQNSALESNGVLISSISGSGFYAESANNSYHADDANHATYADSATFADSANFVATADFANSASSALNAEIANVAYTALTANYLEGGWEHNDDGEITAYNHSAFAGGKGDYTGISPIVVDNEARIISAQSAQLGVQEPLYFVEDSETATVIGIQDSAFPEFQTTNDGKVSAINGSGLYASDFTGYVAGDWIDITGNIISVTGLDNLSSDIINQAKTEITAVDYATSANIANVANSSNSATYDSLGRKIVDTYLTAHQDWTNTIQNASGNAYNSAVNWVVDQHYLTAVTGDNTPYSAGANIDITDHVVSGKDWTSEIQSASAHAVDQATAQIPDVTNLPYVQNTALESNGILISAISGSGLYATSAENAFNADHANEADYVLSGWEYDDEDRISAYNGSAFAGQGGGQGIEYEGVAPIVVNNVEHKISAQSAVLGVQSPLYFVEDSQTATVIGISGLPDVQGLMYESGLNGTGGYITSYNGSGFSATGGGSNPQAPVIGVGSVTIYKPNDTVIISGYDYTSAISAASAYAYSQATAQIPSVVGHYIPYTTITTGSAGTIAYSLNSGIRVTGNSGWVELYGQDKENANEAHLQVAQNFTGSKSFWAEIDGISGGIIQMNWNSGSIAPNSNSDYWKHATACLIVDNGGITYRSANEAVWYTTGNTAWKYGKAEYDHLNYAYSAVTSAPLTRVVASTLDATGSNILYIVTGS